MSRGKMKSVVAAALAVALAAGLAWRAARAQDEAPAAEAASMRPGFRAVTLALEPHQLRFLDAGDRVDVLVTVEAPVNQQKEWMTATVLQNVLALNVQPPTAEERGGVLELMLTPGDAQLLALAVDSGKRLTVARRPLGDAQTAALEPASFRKLFK